MDGFSIFSEYEYSKMLISWYNNGRNHNKCESLRVLFNKICDELRVNSVISAYFEFPTIMTNFMEIGEFIRISEQNRSPLHLKIETNQYQMINSKISMMINQPSLLAEAIISYFLENEEYLQFFASITFPSLYHYFLLPNQANRASSLCNCLMYYSNTSINLAFLSSFFENYFLFTNFLWNDFFDALSTRNHNASIVPFAAYGLFIQSLRKATQKLTKSHADMAKKLYDLDSHLFSNVFFGNVFPKTLKMWQKGYSLARYGLCVKSLLTAFKHIKDHNDPLILSHLYEIFKSSSYAAYNTEFFGDYLGVGCRSANIYVSLFEYNLIYKIIMKSKHINDLPSQLLANIPNNLIHSIVGLSYEFYFNDNPLPLQDFGQNLARPPKKISVKKAKESFTYIYQQLIKNANEICPLDFFDETKMNIPIVSQFSKGIKIPNKPDLKSYIVLSMIQDYRASYESFNTDLSILQIISLFNDSHYLIEKHSHILRSSALLDGSSSESNYISSIKSLMYPPIDNFSQQELLARGSLMFWEHIYENRTKVPTFISNEKCMNIIKSLTNSFSQSPKIESELLYEFFSFPIQRLHQILISHHIYPNNERYVTAFYYFLSHSLNEKTGKQLYSSMASFFRNIRNIKTLPPYMVEIESNWNVLKSLIENSISLTKTGFKNKMQHYISP